MKTRILALAACFAVACIGLAVACDDSSSAVKEPAAGADSGPPPGAPPPPTGLPDAGMLPDGAPADCYMNPTTHFEIINACTNAVKISKNPTLPLLYADGGLPPTP